MMMIKQVRVGGNISFTDVLGLCDQFTMSLVLQTDQDQKKSSNNEKPTLDNFWEN